jgi:fatty acid desaturase
MAWWKDRHNSHHAVTNIVDHDPDIDNIPVLAWAESDLDKCTPGMLKMIQYQHKYFLLALPVLRMAWVMNSVLFVKEMVASPFSSYRAWFKWEALSLGAHHLLVLWIMTHMSPLMAVAWYLVANLLAGFGTAIVVFFNHYSVEKMDLGVAENFIKLQLTTTRNMTPGVVTDWICGGLNYQVEHHLFPTMPRHNLTKCSVFVKQYCEDSGIPYLCCGFNEGLGYCIDFLKDVAVLAEKRLNKAD